MNERDPVGEGRFVQGEPGGKVVQRIDKQVAVIDEGRQALV